MPHVIGSTERSCEVGELSSHSYHTRIRCLWWAFLGITSEPIYIVGDGSFLFPSELYIHRSLASLKRPGMVTILRWGLRVFSSRMCSRRRENGDKCRNMAQQWGQVGPRLELVPVAPLARSAFTGLTEWETAVRIIPSPRKSTRRPLEMKRWRAYQTCGRAMRS